VLALKAVAGAVLCVPEPQAADYRAAHPGAEVVTHPDSVVGLSLKRQWVYEKFGDVFMLDDDVPALIRTYGLAPSTRGRLSPDEARAAIEATAETARALGAYLFGFAATGDQRTYSPQAPFRLTGYCNGCALGLLAGSKLWFHPEAVAVEDFWVSGLNAHHHRFAFFDTRFAAIQKATFANPGGLAEHRTPATEEADYKFLRRMFGDAVRLKTHDERFGRRARRSSAWARKMVLPY
jgi:hypothetical protein